MCSFLKKKKILLKKGREKSIWQYTEVFCALLFLLICRSFDVAASFTTCQIWNWLGKLYLSLHLSGACSKSQMEVNCRWLRLQTFACWCGSKPYWSESGWFLSKHSGLLRNIVKCHFIPWILGNWCLHKKMCVGDGLLNRLWTSDNCFNLQGGGRAGGQLDVNNRALLQRSVFHVFLTIVTMYIQSIHGRIVYV